jgi:hypothetical protein
MNDDDLHVRAFWNVPSASGILEWPVRGRFLACCPAWGFLAVVQIEVFGASGHIRRAGRLSGCLLGIFVLGGITFFRADFVGGNSTIDARFFPILDYIGNGDLSIVKVLRAS